MASSALRSALRFTVYMQAVNLKTKLRLRSLGRHRPSVVNFGATPGLPRSGGAAMSLSGRSNWPNAGDNGMGASSWHASRTCETAWAKALRWDIPRSRSPADWRWNMVASSSAMSQSIVSSIIVRPKRITGIACCRAINSDEAIADAQAAALPASSNNGFRSPNDQDAIAAVPVGHPRRRRRGALSAFAVEPVHHRARAACERRHVHGLARDVAVIASEAKQSITSCALRSLDCFVAIARRTTGVFRRPMSPRNDVST